MSRSYRKNWILKDSSRKKKIDKRFANKAVRNCESIQSGGRYKKVFCSYDICDWRIFWSENPKMGRNPKKSVLYTYKDYTEKPDNYLTPFWKYKCK